MVTPWGFIQGVSGKRQKCFVNRNKQYQRKVLPPPVAFIWMVTLKVFIHRIEIVQHNKQYRSTVLLSNFHLNGHTSRFHPQTQKLATPCTAWWTLSQKNTTQQLSFEWSHFRISSTDSKVRTTLYGIINSTNGNFCSVAFSWMVILYDSSTDSNLTTSLYSLINSTLNGHKVLFIIPYKVVLSYECASEILKCGHSSESYWAV